LHALIRKLVDFLKPELFNIEEGVGDPEIEDQHDALRVFIIGAGNGPKPFLTGGVPDLQFDCRVLVFQRSG
jgi:hypothetical protein